MTTHSPSPWRVDANSNRVFVRDVDGELIAIIHRSAIKPVWRADDNARLIVAAPELLAALKRLAAHVEHGNDDYDAIGEAARAIEKATT